MARLPPDAREADLAPGTTVGDYCIDRTIGVGGMGAVYEATQPIIDKKVAIKVLHRQLCRDRSAVSRFIQEARAVNHIGHPSIVDVFGFGTIDDERAFLVMELLVGETLAVRLQRLALALAEAFEIIVEITHALGAAHDAGIIHRDLKPDNVFLVARTGARAIKLLDFGIAKLSVDGEARSDLTQPGVRVGTPNYISPEQALGLTLDVRSDLYALGVVAFEMVTGRLPFVGADACELIEKHARLRPPRAALFRAGLPAAIDDIIAAMLEKDPARRPSLSHVREVFAEQRALPAAATENHCTPSHKPIATTELIDPATDVMGPATDVVAAIEVFGPETELIAAATDIAPAVEVIGPSTGQIDLVHDIKPANEPIGSAPEVTRARARASRSRRFAVYIAGITIAGAAAAAILVARNASESASAPSSAAAPLAPTEPAPATPAIGPSAAAPVVAEPRAVAPRAATSAAAPHDVAPPVRATPLRATATPVRTTSAGPARRPSAPAHATPPRRAKHAATGAVRPAAPTSQAPQAEANPTPPPPPRTTPADDDGVRSPFEEAR